jgi:hypothetical protein
MPMCSFSISYFCLQNGQYAYIIFYFHMNYDHKYSSVLNICQVIFMSFYHEKFKYRKTNFVENIAGSFCLLHNRYVIFVSFELFQMK